MKIHGWALGARCFWSLFVSLNMLHKFPVVVIKIQLMPTALTGIVFMNMCGWVFCSRYFVSLFFRGGGGGGGVLQKVPHKFPVVIIKIQHA